MQSTDNSRIIIIISFTAVLCYAPGVMHDDLKVFIANNIAQGKKKSKVLFGVADTKLASAIQETLNIQCTSGTA